MIVQLVVGDWSDDGHGKTADFLFETNATSREQIKQAYNIGVSVTGFSIKKACQEYEDYSISKKDVGLLKENGLDISTIDYVDEEDNGDYSLTSEAFATIYAFTVSKGDPAIIFTPFKIDTINIGGYGLFN